MLGCQSQPYDVSNAIRFAYPSMAFAGAYTRQLTVADVRQIVELARHHSRIVKPVHQIVMDRPDEAEVNSGPEVSFALGTTFNVRKQNRRWIVIEKSINTGQTNRYRMNPPRQRPNQSMKPTAAPRNELTHSLPLFRPSACPSMSHRFPRAPFSLFATTPCRGLSPSS